MTSSTRKWKGKYMERSNFNAGGLQEDRSPIERERYPCNPYEEYRTDPMLQSAVERQFEIIGGALNQLLQREPGVRKKISDASLIIHSETV